jgi:hypothetical protein
MTETMKPSALTTVLVSAARADKTVRTQIVPNFSMTMNREKETCDLILHTNDLKGFIPGENVTLGILYTIDPTPCDAFGAVSLGFKRFKAVFQNCRLICEKPPIFRGWFRNYGIDILLEMYEKCTRE